MRDKEWWLSPKLECLQSTFGKTAAKRTLRKEVYRLI
jgi:hypothetical protein